MHSEDSSQVDKTSHDRLDLRRQLDDSVEHAIADPAHSMTALRIFLPPVAAPRNVRLYRATAPQV